MENRCVLLDTNFCIQLLKSNDPLHQNVLGFFRTFLEKDVRLKFSTISIAEYCVRGQLDELPLKNLEILPFNSLHASKAGEFTGQALGRNESLTSEERSAVKDDIKIIAQACVEKEINCFATSDKRLIRTFAYLKEENGLEIEVLNTLEPYSSVLGVLQFDN